MTLHPNSTLQGGKYKIEKVLGQGGFGITYLAEQTMLERKVAIKEFFMKEFCERDESTSHVTLGTGGIRATVDRFREKFLKEARNIAKLKHPHIIQILDVFEENGTAYYVMEYAENGSLSTLVADNKALPEAQATRYILQVADALAYIHQRKMNHLDIKPSNIMLNGEDETLLIDFGLSKQYDEVGQQTSTTPVGLSEGYAPMEQYKQGGVKEFSPETDIYALGATFFKLLTGKTPPGASDVNEDGLPIEELESNGVSQAAIEAITKAMEPRRKKRMHEISEFISSLNDSICSSANNGRQSEAKNIEETIIVSAIPVKKSIEQSRKFSIKGVEFEMLYIEGGTFNMGSDFSEGDSYRDEQPLHNVTLDDFYMGQTVVTQELWTAVMGSNPSNKKGDNLPVENVSWEDCQSFITKLNQLTGKEFRLPTEAEWEFAARGGKKSKGYKYSGSNTLEDVAWYADDSEGKTHPVAFKKPNELGLYDMSGNVWEWCYDWYAPYRSNDNINPHGPYNGVNKVNRGGAWPSSAGNCRVAGRSFDTLTSQYYFLGFRLAMSI